MSVEVGTMAVVGLAVLIAGLVLMRPRYQAAQGAGKLLIMGPVFEAVALAMFAMEHFTAARALATLVPRWLPAHLFWTYFFGVALLAAAISFILWRCVRWSGLLLALFFVLVVATIDVPNLPSHLHERLFWTLFVRETAFACGAMVLAGSVWPRASWAGSALVRVGRTILAPIFVFYAIEHFLFPQFVPGVPLEKLIPAGFPAPHTLSFLIGMTLLVAGVGLVIPRTSVIAAAGSGTVLVLLTALFYLPIFLMEIRTPMALEGLNYVGDTLLFASTALLAGFDGRPIPELDRELVQEPSRVITA
ncbi:MAG TPA: hypothetical protein VGR96_09620 [Acidobacteriaceae bacterium]|nr:hypothetical protein [Acidobacteriaceae bacterium]